MVYNIKKMDYNLANGLICGNFNNNSKLICNVGFWDASIPTLFASPAIRVQGDQCRNKTINVGSLYFKYKVIDNLQGSDILNLNGDLYDIDETRTDELFRYWNSGGSTLNYKGNISLKSPGRAITYTSIPTHKVVIGGNIILSNPSSGYTASLFYSDNGIIDFSGNIYGNMAGNVAMVRNGQVNINNSNIRSSVSGSRLVENTNTSLSTFRLNNSYVELKSDDTPMLKGSYIKQLINNSTLINLGTGSTIQNTTSTGNLQILNSSVISSFSGATSIDYTGSTNVVSSNTTVNTPYSITNLYGNITTLTDIFI
jgi:hypothetical protein